MIHLIRNKGSKESQRGQSIAEVMVSLPFMIAIIVGLVEMGLVFASFVAEVNAAREGAIFASMYPNLANSTCGSIPYPDCTGDYATDSAHWADYHDRVSNEISWAVADALRAGQMINNDTLIIDRPILGPASASCPIGNELGCPITVTVHFRIHTLTSDIQVPYFGRFGLPDYYQINYSFGMPIR